MPRYVIDSYAWIEYLKGTDKAKEIIKIIEDQANMIFTPTIVITEVISITKRENRDFETVYRSMISLSKIYELDTEIAKETGILHAEIKKKINDFGMADAVVLLTARKLKAKVVTGDPHFKEFKDVIFL